MKSITSQQEESMTGVQHISRWPQTLILCLFAIIIWLGVGFSLGWYYTFTYYGRTGIPIPFPEVFSALVLYYFSVLNADTEIQAIHWMVVFPLAGALWVASLRWVATAMGYEKSNFANVYMRFSLAALPVALPAPVLAWLAGQYNGGFDWQRMLNVALRRVHTGPWWWLTPLFLGLGVTVLVFQLIQYRRTFPMPIKHASRHIPLAAIVLSVTSILLGTLASIPLRWWIE